MRARTTRSTWWIIPQGSIQAFRATLKRNVEVDFGASSIVTLAVLGRVELKALFVMARGAMPHFDPATARYATSDMVANLAAHGGIRIDGDVASARRISEGKHAWKTLLTLEEAMAHEYLGGGASVDELISSYETFNAVTIDAEV